MVTAEEMIAYTSSSGLAEPTREKENKILEVSNIFKWFPIKDGILSRTVSNVRAVDGVSLSIKKGESVGLVGESGSGKTTIARLLTKVLPVTRGQILFENQDIAQFKGKSLMSYHQKLQMVFQDPYASLDPRQTVRSTLIEPMKIHGVAHSKQEANDLAEKLIQNVGLNLVHLLRYPHEFSGGQRQRIAIARALAVSPKFLIKMGFKFSR